MDLWASRAQQHSSREWENQSPAGAGSMSGVAWSGTTCVSAGFARDGASDFTDAALTSEHTALLCPQVAHR